MIQANPCTYDAIIIGGGPTGSTAGAALARAGRRVLILEKADLGQYRIGESLLPNGNRILRETGVWDAVETAGFIRKHGAEFETADGRYRVLNDFSRGLVKGLDYTYQAERPRFDQLLLDHAVNCGSTLLRGRQITDIKEMEGGYSVTLDGKEELQTTWLLDASGRSRYLGRKWKLPTDPNPYPPRIAVYNHFRGAARADGPEGGNIIISRLRNGWFWYIPISAELTSVGLVTPVEDFREGGRSPEDWFKAHLDASSAVAARMKSAEAEHDYRTVADYSHMYASFCGDRYFLLGDSAAFTDPIFSSGVYLGLESAHEAALAILKAEGAGRNRLSRHAQSRFTKRLKDRTTVIRQLIDNFYDDAGFAVFMNPTNRFNMFAAVNSIVAGNTRLNFALRWRYSLFRYICRANRNYRLVPRIRLVRPARRKPA